MPTGRCKLLADYTSSGFLLTQLTSDFTVLLFMDKSPTISKQMTLGRTECYWVDADGV